MKQKAKKFFQEVAPAVIIILALGFLLFLVIKTNEDKNFYINLLQQVRQINAQTREEIRPSVRSSNDIGRESLEIWKLVYDIKQSHLEKCETLYKKTRKPDAKNTLWKEMREIKEEQKEILINMRLIAFFLPDEFIPPEIRDFLISHPIPKPDKNVIEV